MYNGTSTAAIIVAAGSGTRMGSSVPKQFLEIAGAPVLVHTITALRAGHEFDATVVVVSPGMEAVVGEMLIRFGIGRTDVVIGGSERQFSVAAGLDALRPRQPGLVLVHDAVRPCIRPSIVTDTLQAASMWGAATTGVVPKDTLKEIDEAGFVRFTPDRTRLRLIQTPQAFVYDIIVAAHAKAAAEQFVGTDDAVLVERSGAPVRIVEGSYENVKVTTPDDIITVAAWLNSQRSAGLS